MSLTSVCGEESGRPGNAKLVYFVVWYGVGEGLGGECGAGRAQALAEEPIMTNTPDIPDIRPELAAARFDLGAAFRARQQKLETDPGSVAPSLSTRVPSATPPNWTGAACSATSCLAATGSPERS
jgi:hypothetical protein